MVQTVNKKRKFLFILPNLETVYDVKNPGIPLTGIGYLSAVLNKENIITKIVDMRLGYDLDALYQIIDEFRPLLIGITCYSYRLSVTYGLIDKLKSISDTPIVVGGPHVSAVRSKILHQTKTDFAIKGEGEFSLLDLYKAIEETSDKFTEIKGLIYRKNGQVIENEDRGPIEDIDSLPFPAYEKFELEKYKCFLDRRLPIITSRGCPYHCTFCSVQLTMGKNFRPRSPESVIEEMRYWYNKGWRNFDFYDDCFTFDISRAEKICDLIIQYNLKINFSFPNGVRADRVNEKLIFKMKRAGLWFITFGVESADPIIQKNIKKDLNLGKIKEAIYLCKKAKVFSLGATFIIGLPGETPKTFKQTFKFAKSLPLDRVNFYNLVPYPKTEASDWVKQNARYLMDEETFLNEISYWQSEPVFETNEFTADQRRKAFSKGLHLFKIRMRRFLLKQYCYEHSKFLGLIIFLSEQIPSPIRKIFTKIYFLRWCKKLYLNLKNKNCRKKFP